MDEPEYYSYGLPQENVLEERAPLYRRVIAFIIDLLAYNFLFYSPFMQAFQVTSGLRGGLLTVDYLLANPLFSVLVASTVAFCFYMALCEYVFGRTIGKHLMGLWIEGKPGLWGFISRNLLKSTFILLLPIDLLGLAFYGHRLIDLSLGVKVLYVNRIGLTEGFI